MRKIHTCFGLMIAMMFFAAAASACSGDSMGGYEKVSGTCSMSKASGWDHSGCAKKSKCSKCSMKHSEGYGMSSDVRSLKRAADILRDEHPLLAARLERLGLSMDENGHGSIH
ncbi:MAG: hypothetical protein KC649_00285 [Candidatus Omnitrophica bacterium]|nr:hypothetical protein [Candidatus Omnitrophota bacterium]